MWCAVQCPSVDDREADDDNEVFNDDSDEQVPVVAQSYMIRPAPDLTRHITVTDGQL